MGSRSSGKLAFVATALAAGWITLSSCVGADPNHTTVIEADASNDVVTPPPVGPQPPPPPPGDGGADAEAGPPGGVTVAQIAFAGDALAARALQAPGGGVLVTVRKNGGPSVAIGGVTIPCSACTYLVKLAPDLHAEWWWTYEAGNELAMSPDGHVYWLLQSDGGFGRTATLASSTGTNQTFAIPGGAGNQGDVAGGAIIVVALNNDGTIRWTHALDETDITEPRTIGARGIAASDKTVFVTGIAAGTLQHTDVLGNRVSKVIGATDANYTHEIDATTGRTQDLVTATTASAFTEHLSVVGSTATAGEGFFAYIDDRANGASAATNYRVVALDATGGGSSPPQILNALTAPGGGNLFLARQGVFAIGAFDVNAVPTFGADTFPPPAGNGKDAYYFLFDNASPKVKAHLNIGGSGYEQAFAIADATGNDVYCLGTYRSSDITVAGKTFPPTPGSVTSGAFVVRAHVDTAAGTMTPVWGAPFTGTARVEPFNGALATDAVTGDAYVVGWLSGGKSDLGLGDVTSPGTGLDTMLWAIRIRR